MANVSFTKHIKANPDHTFGIFTDFQSAERRIEGIKKLELLTDGPIGKGTRFRETRIMFGKEATEEMEITDFRPGRSYTVGGESCGSVWSSTFKFAPNGDGTQVSMEMSFRPVTIFAKLMSPLSFLFAGACKKAMEKDLEDLKKAAETVN